MFDDAEIAIKDNYKISKDDEKRWKMLADRFPRRTSYILTRLKNNAIYSEMNNPIKSGDKLEMIIDGFSKVDGNKEIGYIELKDGKLVAKKFKINDIPARQMKKTGSQVYFQIPSDDKKYIYAHVGFEYSNVKNKDGSFPMHLIYKFSARGESYISDDTAKKAELVNLINTKFNLGRDNND